MRVARPPLTTDADLNAPGIFEPEQQQQQQPSRDES
jgi:hypothetical protein